MIFNNVEYINLELNLYKTINNDRESMMINYLMLHLDM